MEDRTKQTGNSRMSGMRLTATTTREKPKMAVATSTVATMSDAEHRTQLRRALIASTVGTTIEWYDFLLYG
jgi:hypothetical protein